ncbi:hypothetical protein [Corallococcus llansteffanensis]|uniref:Uncharacterized protein n=1 Tax=Corallococcus llansteffanensis TaxID=2316731 RepID=A0A3A8QHT2_9BACT|nr:hypothetical protein [Corallococcus llansteffanensis]RKH68273.1 hypothetical protein D7V93_01525 [Corallococcus llansteffanensis]
MDMREEQSMDGVLTLELRDTGGALLERRRVHNLITLSGKRLLANLLLGKATALPIQWAIAVGTGKGDAQPSDEVLGRQVDRAEASSREVEAVTSNTGASLIRATVSSILPALPAGQVQPLTEAGIEITQGKNTILFNRVRFDEVNRSANMVLNLSWEISF